MHDVRNLQPFSCPIPQSRIFVDFRDRKYIQIDFVGLKVIDPKRHLECRGISGFSVVLLLFHASI